MAGKKRQVSAQTRVKLSQAAKKRHRGLKGTSMGGKFLAGASFSFGGPSAVRRSKFDPFDKEGNKPTGQPHKGPRGENPSSVREFGQSVYADQSRRAQKDPEGVARDITRLTLERHMNPTGDPNQRPIRNDDFVGPSPVISRARKQADEHYKGTHWQDEGVYLSSERKTPARFVREDMDKGHREVYDQLRGDPNSPFNRGLEPGSSGSANRQRKYTDKLQEGWSHEAALDFVTQDARGRPPSSTAAGPRSTQQRQRGRRQQPSRGSKFETVNDKYSGRSKKEMEFGIDAPAAETLDQLSERMPDLTDRQLIQVQQQDRMSIQDEMEKNLLWAHETKRANMLGERADAHGRKSKEDDDRVVFFTTNLGSPAPSVPADSLIGQYIIRRRKKMMKDVGFSSAQLRGEFPRAVRDMHILELSTGISLGVEGRAGVYNETGFRKGTKTSKGYNKPTPLGSHILTDSQGAPLYDAQGNVRYSEGFTRPMNYQSPRAGLKIFIG